MSLIVPFQLLELNIISAQDLAPVTRNMKAYAVAWVHPNRKLTTRVDPNGQTNPSWNDKFVFRVDDAFLYADTSAVRIEIYALHWFRDIHVGTVRILISNLFPPETRPNYFHNLHPQPGMRFVALQVRRASGRPQGILNVGVILLDSSMRSMPLYTNMSSSAVGYRDLMGEEEPYHIHNKLLTSPKNTTTSITSKQYPTSTNSKQYQSSINSKPELRRTKSDTSSMVASELRIRMVRTTNKPSSVINGLEVEASPKRKKKKRTNNHKSNSTAGSMISGSEIATTLSNIEGKSDSTSKFDMEIKDLAPKKTPTHHKLNSLNSEIMDPHPPKQEKLGKAAMLVDESDAGEKPITSKKAVNDKLFSKDINLPAYPYPFPKNIDQYGTPRKSKMEYGTPLRSSKHMGTPRKLNMEYGTPLRSSKHMVPPMKSNFMATPMKSNLEFGTPLRSNLAGRPILTESELGPSPSEVATQMAKERINRTNDTESSIISEWSLEDSVEGLRSKLERWQTELPPLYDLGEKSSYSASNSAAATTDIVPAVTGNRSVKHKNALGKKHVRRHTDAGSGLFSCFSNICGVECSIVCGSGDQKKKSISSSVRPRRTPSVENLSFM